MYLNRKRYINALPGISSITRGVRRSDFTFTGSNLTAVGASIGASGATITGAPQQGANGGFEMKPATTAANYVTLNFPEIHAASYPSGYHIMLGYRRIASDQQAVLLGSAFSSSVYCGAINSADTSSVTESFIQIGNYRIGGADYASGTMRRDILYGLVYNDSVARGVGLQDVFNGANFRPLYYQGFGFESDAEVYGWAVFTNWGQADNVAAWVLA